MAFKFWTTGISGLWVLVKGKQTRWTHDNCPISLPRGSVQATGQGEEPKQPSSLTESRIQRSEVKGAKEVKICEAENGEEDAAERERDRECPWVFGKDWIFPGMRRNHLRPGKEPAESSKSDTSEDSQMSGNGLCSRQLKWGNPIIHGASHSRALAGFKSALDLYYQSIGTNLERIQLILRNLT